MIREEEFSPLKNAPGAAKDTPETARDALCNLHYQYIVNSGGKFMDDNGEILPDIPRYCGSYYFVSTLTIHIFLW